MVFEFPLFAHFTNKLLHFGEQIHSAMPEIKADKPALFPIAPNLTLTLMQNLTNFRKIQHRITVKHTALCSAFVNPI